jgi:hypothetical protein
MPGLRRRAQWPDSLTVGLRALKATFVFREKALLHLGYFAAYYKQVREFLKVNKLFKILTITVFLVYYRTIC